MGCPRMSEEDWTYSKERYSGMNAGPSHQVDWKTVKMTVVEDGMHTPDDWNFSPLEDEVKAGLLDIVDSTNNTYKEKFTTLDSGDREEFSSGMVRDSSEGKARFDLLIPKGVPYEHQFLTRWAKLMERGARKYDARNWEKAKTPEEYDRFKQSAIHHFMQWFMDVEDGEDHAAAIFFNVSGAEYVRWRNG